MSTLIERAVAESRRAEAERQERARAESERARSQAIINLERTISVAFGDVLDEDSFSILEDWQTVGGSECPVARISAGTKAEMDLILVRHGSLPSSINQLAVLRRCPLCGMNCASTAFTNYEGLGHVLRSPFWNEDTWHRASCDAMDFWRLHGCAGCGSREEDGKVLASGGRWICRPCVARISEEGCAIDPEIAAYKSGLAPEAGVTLLNILRERGVLRDAGND